MNNNKLKQIVASSLIAFAGASCTTAPAPWANGQGGAAKGSVAHSHNGVVHTHPLPSAGIHHSHRQGGAPAATNAKSGNGVSHNHNGKTHSHPLPSSGIQHSHSGGSAGSTGSSGGSQAQTSTYDYGNYDYGTGSSSSGSSNGSRSDSGYYDNEYPRSSDRSDSRDDYRYDDSGYGRGGSSSSSSSSSDSGRDYGTYGGDSSSSSSSSSRSTGSDSDYYTVKPKDTVFEVMRQTGAYWKDIIRLNDLKAPKYEIQPGQRLRLPTERNS